MDYKKKEENQYGRHKQNVTIRMKVINTVQGLIKEKYGEIL